MVPSSAARRVAHRLTATAMVVVLVGAAGCGGDEQEDSTRAGPVSEPVSTSSEADAPPADPSAQAVKRYEVTGFDAPTGELLGRFGDSSGGGDQPDPGASLVLDDQTDIEVQGPDGPEPLALEQFRGWLRQRLADLGDTADAVPMEVTYTVGDGSMTVHRLAEVPPG